MVVLLGSAAHNESVMTGHPTSPSDTSRRRGALGRDAALGRLSQVTWWIAAGAAGLTVVLVGLVAHELPGHKAGATVSSGSAGIPVSGGQAPSSGGSSSPSGGSSTNSGGGFSSPPSSPAPTQQAPQAVSGQS